MDLYGGQRRPMLKIVSLVLSMDAIFKLVAHDQSETRTSLSIVLLREAYYSSQVSIVRVASVM